MNVIKHVYEYKAYEALHVAENLTKKKKKRKTQGMIMNLIHLLGPSAVPPPVKASERSAFLLSGGSEHFDLGDVPSGGIIIK